MPEIVNVEMAAAWDGGQGDEWVQREDQMNAALAAHTARLLAAAAVGRNELVLDVGCGTGETTRACAERAVGGRVLGVDLSTAMLERGRMRAADAGLTNIDFERGDAQVYPFASGHFDWQTAAQLERLARQRCEISEYCASPGGRISRPSALQRMSA